MSETKQKCDVCGGEDLIAGVASSRLGPVSYCYCKICLAMHADQKWMIDSVYDPEMENFRSQYSKNSFIYYDPATDNYHNYGTEEIVPLQLKDGRTFLNKASLVEHLKLAKESG